MRGRNALISSPLWRNIWRLALRCVVLRGIALRCVALRWPVLRSVVLRCVAMRCVALRSVAFNGSDCAQVVLHPVAPPWDHFGCTFPPPIGVIIGDFCPIEEDEMPAIFFSGMHAMCYFSLWSQFCILLPPLGIILVALCPHPWSHYRSLLPLEEDGMPAFFWFFYVDVGPF